MANALYDNARQAFLDGLISWSADTIKLTLIDREDYTANLETDEFYSVIPLAARVATSDPLVSKTSTAGVADAADVTFTAVTGDVSEALVLWVDDGVAESSSRLIAYIDVAIGLPVTPNGGDITVQWDSGDNKIFKL